MKVIYQSCNQLQRYPQLSYFHKFCFFLIHLSSLLLFIAIFLFNFLILVLLLFFSIAKIEMGSQIEKVGELDLAEHNPQLEDYKLKHSGTNYYVW